MLQLYIPMEMSGENTFYFVGFQPELASNLTSVRAPGLMSCRT